MPPHPFVAILQQKQSEEGLSDARYARERLRVSPALYSQVLSGGRGIGRKLIIGAFRAYPNPDDQHAMSRALGYPIAPVHRAQPPSLPRRLHPPASAPSARPLAAAV